MPLSNHAAEAGGTEVSRPPMPSIRIDDRQLEYAWLGPGPADAPTLVFLHEGLGCVALWRDFPERLATATGCGALVYSRLGYGNSDPSKTPRGVRFMHDEAFITVPRIMDEFSVERAILVGHSDGGSIALIYAGGIKDRRVQRLMLEAPHVFVEEVGLASIRSIGEDFRKGELRRRMEKYHGRNVEGVFWGWNDVWLNPEFASWNIEEYLPKIEVPVLVVQGSDDQYGSWAQVEAIERGCSGSVKAVRLEGCGHSPHFEQPDRTLVLMTEFVRSSS